LELSKDYFARLDFDHFYNIERFTKQFPETVRFKKLRDVVLLIETGQSVTRKDYATSETDYVQLVPRDIKKGSLDIKDPIYLNPEKGEELSKLRLVEGDVLVAISSICGESAVFHSAYVKRKHYTLSHYIVRLKVNPKVYDPDFLSYYFNHPKIRYFFRAIEVGKLQQNLSKVYLRNFPVIDLPLEQQKITASTLREKRDEIAARQTEIAKLRKESTDLVWNTIAKQLQLV
jgi:restriction endonuclease S subunit